MIRAEHIVKSFDGRVVLNDISADFAPGITNLIIGQSGSGKTVLLKSLVGLHKIDSGNIYYNDVCFNRLPFKERKAIREEVGMIFQGGALLDSSNVEENVRLPLDLFTTMSMSEKRDRVNFCLKRVNLGDVNHLYPAEISGGMIKRVAIARALACEPEVILCDEATSALDPKSTNTILKLLRDINEETGVTLIVITHSMDVVEKICKNVAVLENGRVVEQGAVADVFSAPRADATRVLLGKVDWDA